VIDAEFSCISLHDFVPRVGRNCAHNPKAVSSDLTPATKETLIPRWKEAAADSSRARNH